MCERLIAHFAGRFRVINSAQADSSYWFDLEQHRQPLRLAAPPAQITPGLRFFATTAAHTDVLTVLVKLDQTGQLPSGIDFGGTPDVGVVREVFKHLSLNWAPKPPVRKSARQPVQARMTVYHGFVHLVELMKASSVDFALDVDAGDTETWVVENMSAGGFGATVLPVKGDWLKIGALLAVQPDMPSGGGRWDLAIVRRLARDSAAGAAVSKNQASTGVQILSRTAIAVSLTNAGGAWGDGRGIIDGIYYADPAQAGAAVLVLPANSYLPGEQVQTEIDGRVHILFPVAVTDQGDDYELVSFRDMVQDG